MMRVLKTVTPDLLGGLFVLLLIIIVSCASEDKEEPNKPQEDHTRMIMMEINGQLYSHIMEGSEGLAICYYKYDDGSVALGDIEYTNTFYYVGQEVELFSEDNSLFFDFKIHYDLPFEINDIITLSESNINYFMCGEWFPTNAGLSFFKGWMIIDELDFQSNIIKLRFEFDYHSNRFGENVSIKNGLIVAQLFHTYNFN